MRKSAIMSVVLHVLAGVVALLWLLWYFIPVGVLARISLTLGIAARASGFLYKVCCRVPVRDNAAVPDLSLVDMLGPIVLVCGDGLHEIFQAQHLRKTSQGCWLKVENVASLSNTVRHIQMQAPRQTGQLSVMFICLPDRHQNEAVLRASVKTLRQQIKQINTFVGFSLPVVLNGEFSGPETPWVIVRGNNPVVCPSDETPLVLGDWQSRPGNPSRLPILRQAFAFMRDTILDELEKTDALYPPVHPFAVALRAGAPRDKGTVWSAWLYRRTFLMLPLDTHQPDAGSRFPDAVLAMLTPFSVPVQGRQHTRRVVALLWLCALAAIGFSAVNNAGLIRKTGADLQRWYAIASDRYEAKARSLAVLEQNALLLERWQRQGEPLRYGLGYYPGQRLWLALQQAIDTYSPPPPKPDPAPVATIVRLDSMSLFDSGKAALKPGSTKMLINSLVDIKAKPGWLIVVSGHTDNTGSAPQNQSLSLKRAEAVRDWMRDTGDVPESCFAVQGYGDSRPVAPNDTPEGRARNRRVEISLVPQADACRVPDITPPSSQDGDGL